MRFRVAGIPLWVTIYVGFFMIFSTVLGVRALIDPTTALGYVPGAEGMGLAWGGRNAGIGLAQVVAFFTRSPAAYAAVFLACTLREIGDLLSSLAGPPSTEYIAIGVLAVVEFIAFLLSLRAAIKAKTRAEVL